MSDPALGFMGGIGLQAKVAGKVRAFIELQFSHIIFKEENKVLTSYVKNGNEIISSFTLSQTETVYKKGYVSSNNVATNPDKPSFATYQRIPITYIGAQAGLIYRF